LHSEPGSVLHRSAIADQIREPFTTAAKSWV
jgi:hypothetical protein